MTCPPRPKGDEIHSIKITIQLGDGGREKEMLSKTPNTTASFLAKLYNLEICTTYTKSLLCNTRDLQQSSTITTKWHSNTTNNVVIIIGAIYNTVVA